MVTNEIIFRLIKNGNKSATYTHRQRNAENIWRDENYYIREEQGRINDEMEISAVTNFKKASETV